ncbi:MAG: SMI1/KNR4 family protein [Acidobacteriota bacterium]
MSQTSVPEVVSLSAQISQTLPPGLRLLEPIDRLFSWIESRGTFIDRGDLRIGTLFDEDRIRAEGTETERPGGTWVRFFAEGDADYLEDWFGNDDPEVAARLALFAQTGWDGSRAAFWLDDEGQQRIVHMSSGGGLVCTLGKDAVDFLRLLAIGYDEIVLVEQFAALPNADPGERVVHPNREYRQWVETTFGVSIPRTAREIVRHPAQAGDVDSPDSFCRWVERLTG